MKKRLTKTAVKESFDNLPSGICYFDRNGLPILCNRQMHRLIFALTGESLQLESDITDLLSAEADGCSYKKDGDIFILLDDSAWHFDMHTVDVGQSVTEYIASDVTELYARKKELDISTEEYKAKMDSMRKIMENLTAITREEELLTMKMQIHGEVGCCLGHIRRSMMAEDLSNSKEAIVNEVNDVIDLLQGEVGNDDAVDPLEELLRVSLWLGVKVEITGDKCQIGGNIIKAIRECVTNTLGHAKGDIVTVHLTQTGETVIGVITNNGEPPKSEIVEGGGLSSLRKSIEKCGGSMKVQSLPYFALTVTLNIGE